MLYFENGTVENNNNYKYVFKKDDHSIYYRVNQNELDILSGKSKYSDLQNSSNHGLYYIYKFDCVVELEGLDMDIVYHNFSCKKKDKIIINFNNKINLDEMCGGSRVGVVDVIPFDNKIFIVGLGECRKCFFRRLFANSLNIDYCHYIVKNNNVIKNSFSLSEVINILGLVSKNDSSGVVELSANNKSIKIPCYPDCNEITHNSDFQVEDAIDENIGIIKNIFDVSNIEDVKYLTSTVYYPNSLDELVNANLLDRKKYVTTGGVSINFDKSLRKNIGESFERLSLRFKRIDLTASIEELNSTCRNYVVPKFFSKEQYNSPNFKYSRIESIDHVEWTSVRYLHKDEPLLIPSSLIYTCDSPETKDIYCKLSTSGTAAGDSISDSIRSGLLELIERDSSLLFWNRREDVKEINIEDFIYNEEIKKIFKIISKSKYEIKLFDTSTNDLKVPSVFVLATLNSDERQKPYHLVGAAAKLTYEEAIIRALEEIIQGFGWQNYLKFNDIFEPGDNYCNVRTFINRIELYADAKNSFVFDFTKKSKFIEKNILESRHITTTEELITRVVTFFPNSYYIDLSSEMSKSYGIYCTKVIIPELLQIEEDHNYRFLGVNRLYGREGSLSISEFPHPYP
ncbi:YcaO-like family protein [Vibrio jasicida]|uniref:YcaO-like family protein n=1 Tax=Vibrio jasicida TaxID=766224 RepID=UPI0005EF94E3|nr:YcaO-like family protein [Vibrio jasicida]